MEPLPSTDTVRSVGVAVNDAVGAVSVGRPVAPRLKWFATWSAGSTVGYRATSSTCALTYSAPAQVRSPPTRQ